MFVVVIEFMSNAGGDVVVVLALSSVVDTRVGVGVVASAIVSTSTATASATTSVEVAASVSSTIGIASVRPTIVLVSAGTLVSDVVS